MSSNARLNYKIVRCSSEDPEFPVTELLAHSSQTKGWQTARFCDFPQEICLQFETPVHLRQIQFLSHQSKIATKIELFTASASNQGFNVDVAEWKRLGYLPLDNNERSQFQARELKSVYVDVCAQGMRILFHKCHVNQFNIVNQVGLIALRCAGEVLGPDLALGQPPPNPSIGRPSVTRPAPAAANAQLKPAPPGPDAAQAEADAAAFDPKTLERIQALSAAKQRAVEAEDYEEAKHCKEMLARLRHTGTMLRELEDRKRQAVQNEDYDAAKALKVEIDRLRQSLDRPDQPPPQAEPSLPVGRGGPPEWAAPGAQGSPNGFASPQPSDEGGRGPGKRSPASFDAGPPPPALFQAPGQRERQTPSPTHGEHENEQAHVSPPRSPPVPAAANGGGGPGRMVHSPVGGQGRVVHSPLVGQQAGAPQPPPPTEQPLEREQSADFTNHPLAGVPNIEDLGEPEAVAAKEKEAAGPVSNFVGDYITRSLFSKQWNLRDAAVQKVLLDFNAGNFDGMDPSDLLKGMCLILKRAVPDKNPQVFLAAIALQQAMCKRLLRGKLRQAEVHKVLEPIMPLIVDRLGDNNARVDKGAKDAHQDFARCALVGTPFTSSFVSRPPAKKAVPQRVCSSRLQLLALLVAEAGVQPDSREGVSLDPPVQLAMEWSTHAHADVRENAVKLVGACYSKVGLQRLEPTLKKLSEKQRAVFETEFERVDNEPAGGDDGWAEMPAPQVPPPRQQQQKAQQKPPPQQQQQQAPPEQADQGSADDVCDFCGRQDPAFATEGIDVHYWKECPMLMECEYCKQVIEIASLVDHWNEECEHAETASARASQLSTTQCPLCETSVGAGEDQDWQHHLLTIGCCKNPRNKFRPR